MISMTAMVECVYMYFSITAPKELSVVPDDESEQKIDTLKVLQSKFGSPVYDPTSPLQKAYGKRGGRQ